MNLYTKMDGDQKLIFLFFTVENLTSFVIFHGGRGLVILVILASVFDPVVHFC